MFEKVPDMGCGKAGPAVVLAEVFGCRILGVRPLLGCAILVARKP
ncbi:MAG TPA: hypothetical protein VNS99_03840 [Gaiellales bacterium]|nr:hypothetical protein [Gaiellales bacterium]